MSPLELHVHQVNCFYNYTAGLETMEVDLLKTAANLLGSGITRTVCFSDLKSMYLDEEDAVRFESIQTQGRRWDSRWTVKFSEDLPYRVAEDLIFCLELSFHENQIEGPEGKQMPPHLRTPLPPITLDWNNCIIPIYPWLKIYSDGIVTLSFQLDTTWDGLSESSFIDDIVNLFQKYFNRIWVKESIQRLDAEQVLPEAFEEELSFGGQKLGGRKSRRLLKEMRRKSREFLDKSLGRAGHSFDIGGETWTLHPIAGSEDQEQWEATIDMCRSLYINAVTSLVVPRGRKRRQDLRRVKLWQGRPSISLMRFDEQPDSKSVLLERFGPSISRILMRSPKIPDPPALPPDLRLFDDYCFHGNRALLLWTWLRPVGSPDDAWADSNTRAHVLENQARAEHFEYHNLRIARACATAAAPPTDNHLIAAYEVLASTETAVHHSSQSGELTDALEYMLSAAGTSRLVAAGKEQARWHLDERRYQAEKERSRVDLWLTAIFGLVGTAGLANLVAQPFLKELYPGLGAAVTGLFAFLISFGVVGLIAILIWSVTKFRRNERAI
jgi:hypothetical protein